MKHSVKCPMKSLRRENGNAHSAPAAALLTFVEEKPSVKQLVQERQLN